MDWLNSLALVGGDSMQCPSVFGLRTLLVVFRLVLFFYTPHTALHTLPTHFIWRLQTLLFPHIVLFTMATVFLIPTLIPSPLLLL